MKKPSVTFEVERLLEYAVTHLRLPCDDIIYARNKLLGLLNLPRPDAGYEGDESIARMKSPAAILSKLVAHAVDSQLINRGDSVELESRIMDIVCPPPSRIIEDFDNAACQSTKAACDEFYDFCLKSNYIRYDDTACNVSWTAEGKLAPLLITINTAKPEKDNAQTAAKRATASNSYPDCPLCKENVGFCGAPFRHTLRTIPIELNGEAWHLQYSPYNYFTEHCIALSDEHSPMTMTPDTLKRLLDFIEIFPHYFIGSNATLPIVGGSLLMHEHFQGGLPVLPLFEVKPKLRLISEEIPNVRITLPDWYNSVVRIESTSRQALLRAACLVMRGWREYNNPECEIVSQTTEPHSDITPIARFNDKGEYCMDIILRNNRTDDMHPDGIFHVSAELQNIKKEAIGLIEAGGIFILPARLAHEAAQIKDYLTGSTPLNLKELASSKHPLNRHLGFVVQLVNDYGIKNDEETAGKIIEKALNGACEKILSCTAVFKPDKKGDKAFLSFLATLGFSKSTL